MRMISAKMIAALFRMICH